jgi:hypothetical protein
VVEDHQETSNTRPVIIHKGNPSDFVLNTAKMRDAKHIQKLCEPLIPLDTDWAIMQGCAHETDYQKSMQHSTNISQPQASSSGLHSRGSHASHHGRGSQSALGQSVLSAD